MSSASKGTAIRLIVPEQSSPNIVSSLGRTSNFESTNLTLNSGRLTTEDIVKNIRELTRLKDELLHTIRQLGIPRQAAKSDGSIIDYEKLITEARHQLEKERKQYQENQSRIETLERQIEEAKKQSAKLSGIIDAGFTSANILSAQGQFGKIIGRLPVRKLDAAQRVLATNSEDIIISQGNRKKDWVYILLVAPHGKIAQVLHTLILYDFVQTEIPASEEPDLIKSVKSLDEKREKLSTELELARTEMKEFRNKAGKTLNQLADMVQDAIIILRGILRLGDAAKVTHAFAWLEKPPNPKALEALSERGGLVETE